MYGKALLRFIHGIHQIHFRHKNKIILVSKTDLDAAFRCIHANIAAAVSCITIIDDIAHILLRLPFGSSPAPSIFDIPSQILCDITTTLANDPTWNPDELHATKYYKFMEDLPIEKSDISIPFGHAEELFVDIINSDTVFDIYIDDLIAAALDTPSNDKKLLHAPALAIHTLFCPTDDKDPLPRDKLINITKHKAEAKLEERKIVLGWEINTRTFRIYLPKSKHSLWLSDIEPAIHKSSTTIKIFESIIGHLNHAGYILPFGRYFLSRLRFCLCCSREQKAKIVNFNEMEKDDLRLWIKFLVLSSSKGTDLNHLTFTHPSMIPISDACEHGIGGFLIGGLAW